MNTEILEIQIKDQAILFEDKITHLEKHFDEKMDYLEKRIFDKIDTMNKNQDKIETFIDLMSKRCDTCSIGIKVEKHEEEIKKINSSIIYASGAIATIIIIAGLINSYI